MSSCAAQQQDIPSTEGLASAVASTRRLAAILAADMVGYSRLMGLDEAGSVPQSTVKANRAPRP